MTCTESPTILASGKFAAFLVSALILGCVSAASAQDPAASPQSTPATATQSSPASAQNPPAKPAESTDTTSGPSLFEHWKINLDLGGRDFDLFGDHPGKYLEHKDDTRGFFARDAGLRFESAGSPYSFWFNASAVHELDETVAANFSKGGKYQTTFLWSRIPRFYSDGTSLYQEISPGNLVVSPSIRAGFQAIVDGQTGPNVSPALAPFARAELASVVASDLRITRDEASILQKARFGRLELHIEGKTSLKRGTRPKGNGTFGRLAIGPFGDGRWESFGAELPERVDYRTNSFKAGAVVSGAKWRFGVDYRATLFRDNVKTLTYENPFRVTDTVAVPGNPPPTAPQVGPPFSPGSAIGRNRFVRQQLSLPPDTDYHSVTGWFGIDLPRNSQFRGLISWGQSSQNDPFVAYSLNAALDGPSVSCAGAGPTAQCLGFANNIPAGTSVTSVAALPQRSLNGQVRNLNYDSAIVSKPWKNMNFRLQYRNEDMKNKSPNIRFPGFSRFGESHWVTAVDYYNVPIQNLPTSFVRQDAIASLEWDLTSWVTWDGEYQYEVWRRTNRDVPHSSENSFLTRLDFKLPKKAKFEASFGYGDRVPDSYRTVPMSFNPNLNSNNIYLPAGSYGPGWEVSSSTVFDPTVALEFSQLRRFDQGGRRRYDGKATLDVPLGSKVTWSGSYRYLRDKYTPSLGNAAGGGFGFWGLQFDNQHSVDSELTFSVGERTFFYVNYNRQLDTYDDLGNGALICGGATGSCVSGAPANISACCAVYPVDNSWDRNVRSTLDGGQIGINWASGNEKTTIDLSYDYSRSLDQTHTSNPLPILSFSPLTAGTYNYPDTTNRFQGMVLSITRKLRPGLESGVQYRFESYLLDDFFLNNLRPYSQGLFAPGASACPVAGDCVAFLARQLFLNARFTTAHVHEEAFFLRYSF